MTIICPTVTAGTPQNYKEQMERVALLAKRVHIDLMDGKFAPHKSVALSDVWWPTIVAADLHIMYQNPGDHLKDILRLKPNMVIVHAEADGNFFDLADSLKKHHIKVGLALLQDTPVSHITPIVPMLDHALIFSGTLGSFGGVADLRLLDKVKQLKELNPHLEIGWDGGINGHNVRQLADGGINVLNVGGFIHRADNPPRALYELERKISHKFTRH